MDKKRKWIIIISAALFVMAAVGVFAYTTYFYNNKKYTDYKVVYETPRVEDGVVNYQSYNDIVLKCGREGTSALDAEGKESFNGGYDMKNPVADVCESYVVVADQGEKRFVVFNGDDSGTPVDTTLPIVSAKVTANGVVAVLLEDVSSNVIQIYNPYASEDRLLAEVPTNVQTQGYPVDYDISPNGENLVTDFMLPKQGNPSYHVSFYNFSDVGQEKNQLVGAKTYSEQAVGKVEFMNNDYACVYIDNGYEVYSNFLKPQIVSQNTFDGKITSLLANEDYVCVIIDKKLTIYSLKGNELLTKELTYEYNKVRLFGKELYFTTDHQCVILRSNGMEKWVAEFKNKVEEVFPASGMSHYFLITDQNIQEINIK